jgi:hypothetical protein
MQRYETEDILVIILKNIPFSSPKNSENNNGKTAA